MDCHPLEITVISADGLKNVNNFTKMDVYIVVSIDGDPSTARKSPVHKDAGSSPRWNHHFRFQLDEHTIKNRSLLFVIKSDRALGDRDIGEVSVSIADLFDKSTLAAATMASVQGGGGDDATAAPPKIQPDEEVMEYDVRTTSGVPKGVLKFAYKFGEKYTRQIAAAPPYDVAAKGYSNVNEPVTAYPAVGPSTQAAGMMYPGGAGPYPPHPAYYAGYQAAPPQGYAAYPPPQGGYPGYPPAGYPAYGGYQQVPPPQFSQQPHKKKMGGGSKLGLGLGAGLLGGLLVGDMIGDMGEMAAYDAGYDAGFGDGGDFDF